ncbi:hypothetical protein FP2506_04050 [Fulvimarina pelagi HTCC2506]|uniref:C-type lysozyme inhibitor domain-containing protein n=2 Tax=Fulvimarina pelagi TaxID=217511 RepID=Q0FZA8_9HYPH|nr:MliC family protein [Fulvimarina pelagi]EAU40370.1 hypothetical protein FP2506_04050 [Fulvimarina pelagi HTCC2506]BAT31407.1 hypothetical protein [Fulvimarina pelagi]
MSSLFRTLLTVAAFTTSLVPAVAQIMDVPGRSYGGVVRSGPGLNYPQIASTRLNDDITLLQRSARMDDYNWFQIRLSNGLVGYQFGGLFCAHSEESGVLTICGSELDAQLSGYPARTATTPQPQPQPRQTIVEYSCNEGIPLIARYVDEPDGTVAYVSHDSYPEVRLPQIVSGSGIQFQSGPNWFGGKGREMSINFNGIEDTCYEARVR